MRVLPESVYRLFHPKELERFLRKTAKQIELERAAGTKGNYNVFMALANHIGHDKRGNKTYVRDENGDVVTETRRERIREIHNGVATFREVETTTKIEDDNTEQIAERFGEWLKEQT